MNLNQTDTKPDNTMENNTNTNNQDDTTFSIYWDENGKMRLSMGKSLRLILVDLEYNQDKTRWYKVQENNGKLQNTLLHMREEDKENPDVLFLIGLSNGIEYLDKSYIEEALTNWRKDQQHNPNLSEALYNRGILYKKMEDYDNAMRDFLQVKEIGHLKNPLKSNINKEIKEIQKITGTKNSFWEKIKNMFS